MAGPKSTQTIFVGIFTSMCYTFAGGSETSKFVKVFSLESFPLYGSSKPEEVGEDQKVTNQSPTN